MTLQKTPLTRTRSLWELSWWFALHMHSANDVPAQWPRGGKCRSTQEIGCFITQAATLDILIPSAQSNRSGTRTPTAGFYYWAGRVWIFALCSLGKSIDWAQETSICSRNWIKRLKPGLKIIIITKSAVDKWQEPFIILDATSITAFEFFAKSLLTSSLAFHTVFLLFRNKTYWTRAGKVRAIKSGASFIICLCF